MIDNKRSLFRLLLPAGEELIISDLNLYRLFPQYWLLMRKDPDALIYAFPTVMIVTGPKRPRAVVIDHHDKLLPPAQACGCSIAFNVPSILADVSGSSPGMGDLLLYV